MNISGISPAASLSGLESSAAMDVAASVKILDMAQDVFSVAAEKLIAEMAAAMTGVGGNVDMYA